MLFSGSIDEKGVSVGPCELISLQSDHWSSLTLGDSDPAACTLRMRERVPCTETTPASYVQGSPYRYILVRLSVHLLRTVKSVCDKQRELLRYSIRESGLSTTLAPQRGFARKQMNRFHTARYMQAAS